MLTNINLWSKIDEGQPVKDICEIEDKKKRVIDSRQSSKDKIKFDKFKIIRKDHKSKSEKII